MKTYFVSGVSRGLGKAVAELLLEAGNNVYGTYNTGNDAIEKMQKEYPLLMTYQSDFSKIPNINTMLDELTEIKFDGIVNSAGVFIDVDPDNIDMDLISKTFNVNSFAPLIIAQRLSYQMKSGGSIVNISSTDANVGSTTGFAYAASKAALNSFTKSMALLFADKNIRSNSLNLGWMGDGMRAPDELLKIAADFSPSKRVATYEEVAKTVVFLLSEDASYINGSIVTVDGADEATSYVLQKEAEL